MTQQAGRHTSDSFQAEPNGSAGPPSFVRPSRPSSTPVWLLSAVALGAVLVTLGAVYLGFRLLMPAQGPTAATTVPTTAPAAQPIISVAGAAATAPVAAAPVATAPVANTCSGPLSDAQSLSQARRFADAAAKLESVRSQCDVVGPLYDAYLNQARSMADDERAGDAVTLFDKALQVKNGTEASNEKALAQAYQDGRAALDKGDLDNAIADLSRVQAANPNYARGNNTLNLINAYLAQGDQLASQSNCGDALGFFQRAAALKPNEPAITQRINTVQQCNRPTLVPPPVVNAVNPAPVAAVAAPPVEPTVQAYYAAINSKRFADAYSILSSSARSTQSLASFASRFDTNRGIGVRYIDGVSVQGSSAQLSAHTQTTIQERTGLVTSCSRVVWVLVLEGGQWRRDIRSESNNEFGESC